MILRSHQHAPVAWLAKRKFGLVVSPAGSGKTVIAAAALATVLEAKDRQNKIAVGWMANTHEQCQQARAALDLFQSVKDLCVVRIACAAAATDWSDCKLLIVDEAHHAAAPGWREQIETCPGARWGFTATPDAEGEDAEDRDAALRELFGEERFIVDRDEVGSLVTKARVVLLEASDPGLRDTMDAEINRLYHQRLRWWREEPGKLWAMVSWQVCVEMGIVTNDSRTLEAVEVARCAIAEGESVLVLVNQVEHSKQVAALVGAVACYSGMGAKNRRAALEAFKSGELKCVVATSLADEGLDVPRASVLVLVSGGRSRAKAEQRTGRVLRAFAGKEHGLIYDFNDETVHPLMHKHALARQDVYRQLGYEIQPVQDCQK